jgi:hypothetical protein
MSVRRFGPLMAKLPGGALVGFFGPTEPVSMWTSVASLSDPFGWMGSTAMPQPL